MDAGRGLTLANDPVQWGERVETYGYPFPLAVPDQVYPASRTVVRGAGRRR